MGRRHNTTKTFKVRAYRPLYGVPHTQKRPRHGILQNLDGEHRTDSRRPLDQPPGTTTETDEDRDGRRRRLAKTETDEDRLILGTGKVAAPLQLTAPRSNEDGT